MRTPWGNSDYVKEIGRGILRVDTPSHGGYFVPERVRGLMPAPALITFAGPGWYEEDSDWCLVALSFPELFPPDALEMARRTAANWHSREVCRCFRHRPGPPGTTTTNCTRGMTTMRDRNTRDGV